MLVAPSMLSADFGNMERDVKAIEKWGADIVHCDVMDGVYVPNITFGMPMVKALKANSNLTIDVHLMITLPENTSVLFAMRARISSHSTRTRQRTFRVLSTQSNRRVKSADSWSMPTGRFQSSSRIFRK